MSVESNWSRFPTLAEVEFQHICYALHVTGGNVKAASKLLGMKRTTLDSRMKKLGIRRNREVSSELSLTGSNPPKESQ